MTGKQPTVPTTTLQKIADDILTAVRPLAMAYPENSTQFLRVLMCIYRKNVFTLSAIRYLTNHTIFGDSALALSRKLMEDMVAVEWMLLFQSTWRLRCAAARLPSEGIR